MPFIKMKEYKSLLEVVEILKHAPVIHPPSGEDWEIRLAQRLVDDLQLLIELKNERDREVFESFNVEQEIKEALQTEDYETVNIGLTKDLKELQEHVHEVKRERNRLFYENESLKKIVQEHLSCQLTLMSIIHGKKS